MRARQVNRVSGKIVIALSLVALLTVLSGYLQPPHPPEPDEGAAAHIFQLSIVALAPALVLFFVTADWKQPARSARPLAIPAAALIVAFAVLYHVEHNRHYGNVNMRHPAIHSNMNFPAPVAVLGFLAAIAGFGLCVLAAVAFTLLHKTKWTGWVGALVAAGAVVYFGLLFGFSLGSREVTLAPGAEKYFCEIDCHLAYSVQASREEFQGGQRQLHVTLRTRFDETTTAPWRPKDAPLTPNSRQVRLLDRQGRSYSPDVVSGTPLTRALVPAHSYDTELIFRIPADASGFRLLVTTAGWDERLLIGEENSLGHKKTYLAIPFA